MPAEDDDAEKAMVRKPNTKALPATSGKGNVDAPELKKLMENIQNMVSPETPKVEIGEKPETSETKPRTTFRKPKTEEVVVQNGSTDDLGLN
jgi:hypothetical protein